MFIEKIYNCTRTKEFSQFEETIATFFSGERTELRESERERVGERERERRIKGGGQKPRNLNIECV